MDPGDICCLSRMGRGGNKTMESTWCFSILAIKAGNENFQGFSAIHSFKYFIYSKINK
jgi:hypothetical protein